MYYVKNFFFMLVVWLLPTKPVIHATSTTQAVLASLRTGDAAQLASRFARNIELVIDTEQVDFPTVDASHAEQILRTFFRKHPPQRFQFVYQGASDQLRYSTGTYNTNGQAFAVYVMMRQNAHRQVVINGLHFRKE